ncbi:hypothetical protein [Pyrococcus kukulkanii]|uniref:Uncharacterized protein n=1 Tax=Pyrococcus kukulkanii TaxID=1609559 RepID=A0ABV4T946_9EURY
MGDSVDRFLVSIKAYDIGYNNNMVLPEEFAEDIARILGTIIVEFDQHSNTVFPLDRITVMVLKSKNLVDWIIAGIDAELETALAHDDGFLSVSGGTLDFDTIRVEYRAVKNSLANILEVTTPHPAVGDVRDMAHNLTAVWEDLRRSHFITKRVVLDGEIARETGLPTKLHDDLAEDEKRLMSRYYRWFLAKQEEFFRAYREYITEYRGLLRALGYGWVLEEPQKVGREHLSHIVEELDLNPIITPSVESFANLERGTVIIVEDTLFETTEYMYIFRDDLGNFVMVGGHTNPADYYEEEGKVVGGLKVFECDDIPSKGVEVQLVAGQGFRVTGNYRARFSEDKFYVEVKDKAVLELVNGSRVALNSGAYIIEWFEDLFSVFVL